MLEIVIKQLKEMSCIDLKIMSDQIGVSYETLISIRYGRIKNPTLETFLKIQSYFE